MYYFLKKYYYIIIYLIIIFFIINFIKNILNIYSLSIIILLIILLYKKNKRLFKRIIYKTIYNNKSIKINSKFIAAKKSLKKISEVNNLIIDRVNSEVIYYEKLKIEKRLKYSDYNVILFGAGSCGKTSLASAILKNIVGDISPTMGTTKEITFYKINIPFLKRKMNIIDTPGLFEASLEGEINEKYTIKKAAKSDLIIFVVDQDLNKYELYLLKELSKIGKSIIIALNKCDLRTSHQNSIIKNNIYELTKRFSTKFKIIETISAPQTISRNNQKNQRGEIEVDDLFNEIINILDKEGEELIADNILFQCNKLGYLSKNIINEQRSNLSKNIINKYTWVTSGVILLTPIPAIDLLATSAVNIQMIIEISKIYGTKLTKDSATELSKSILGVIATLGIVRGGMNLITNLLSTNFTTAFISKSAQSITGGWIIRIVGLSLIKYFENNENWGDGGIQEVIQELYNLNKREEILNNFLNEALNKIKNKNNQSLRKELPPYLQDD
tara:strand:- start:1554 stop:3053 length:1500 start_codon:yes stop_codon:yes gene_type:complete